MVKRLDISPSVLAEFSTVAQIGTSSTFLRRYGKFLERVKTVHAKDRRGIHRCLRDAVNWYSQFMDMKYEAIRLGYFDKVKIIDNEIAFLESLIASLQRRYEKALWM